MLVAVLQNLLMVVQPVPMLNQPLQEQMLPSQQMEQMPELLLLMDQQNQPPTVLLQSQMPTVQLQDNHQQQAQDQMDNHKRPLDQQPVIRKRP
jgi:hypothetical protein